MVSIVCIDYTCYISLCCPGVRSEWIQWIINQNCIPRKSPLAYDCFTMTSTVMDRSVCPINPSSLSMCGFSSVATLAPPVYSWAEIELHTGLAEADREDLWIVINQKVIKFVGDVTSFFPFGYFTKYGFSKLVFAYALLWDLFYMSQNLSRDIYVIRFSADIKLAVPITHSVSHAVITSRCIVCLKNARQIRPHWNWNISSGIYVVTQSHHGDQKIYVTSYIVGDILY